MLPITPHSPHIPPTSSQAHPPGLRVSPPAGRTGKIVSGAITGGGPALLLPQTLLDHAKAKLRSEEGLKSLLKLPEGLTAKEVQPDDDDYMANAGEFPYAARGLASTVNISVGCFEHGPAGLNSTKESFALQNVVRGRDGGSFTIHVNTRLEGIDAHGADEADEGGHDYHASASWRVSYKLAESDPTQIESISIHLRDDVEIALPAVPEAQPTTPQATSRPRRLPGAGATRARLLKDAGASPGPSSSRGRTPSSRTEPYTLTSRAGATSAGAPASEPAMQAAGSTSAVQAVGVVGENANTGVVVYNRHYLNLPLTREARTASDSLKSEGLEPDFMQVARKMGHGVREWQLKGISTQLGEKGKRFNSAEYILACLILENTGPILEFSNPPTVERRKQSARHLIARIFEMPVESRVPIKQKSTIRSLGRAIDFLIATTKDYEDIDPHSITMAQVVAIANEHSVKGSLLEFAKFFAPNPLLTASFEVLTERRYNKAATEMFADTIALYASAYYPGREEELLADYKKDPETMWGRIKATARSADRDVVSGVVSTLPDEVLDAIAQKLPAARKRLAAEHTASAQATQS